MIFYFSGAGNSYAAALQVAESIDGERVVPLAKFKDFKQCQKEERIGIVFPCYMGEAPRIVKQFKDELVKKVDTSNIYVFVIITYNHSDAATYLEFKDTVDAWFRVRMPQSDIYNAKAATLEVENKLLTDATRKIGAFAEDIRQKKHTVMYKRIPVLATIAKVANRTLMYKNMGSKLYADDHCTKCQQCLKFCPVSNITFEKGLIWGNQCQSCFGCINRCPQNAIQFGKKTIGKKRYVNPNFKTVYYTKKTVLTPIKSSNTLK